MSDPVLSQLVAVEDDLAQQVEALETKLGQLKEQHQGLQTVIGMFQGSGDESASASSVKQTSTAKAAAKKPGRKAKAKPGPKAKAKPGRKAKAKPGPKAKAKPGPKAKAVKTPALRKKKDGRAATWQKYVHSVYRDAALPEAVSSVLRGNPSDIFTIADVMSSIFTEDMPRTSFLKARNRISNILSAGARDGTWYRGRNGRYSQSESVTKLK